MLPVTSFGFATVAASSNDNSEDKSSEERDAGWLSFEESSESDSAWSCDDSFRSDCMWCWSFWFECHNSFGFRDSSEEKPG